MANTSNAISFNVIAGPLTSSSCFPVTSTPSPTVGPEAVQVTINNFDVTQKLIPSTASSVDFVLRISQQDQTLSCPGGYLDWAVWSALTPGGTPQQFVRRHNTDSRNTNLPLSPNPMDLNFNIPNFTPGLLEKNQGHTYFYAALGCNFGASNVYVTKLAISAPVRVNMIANSSRGVGIDNFDLNPKTICNPTNPTGFNMTLMLTIDPAGLASTCGSGNASSFDWYIEKVNTVILPLNDPVVAGKFNQPVNVGLRYTLDLSRTLGINPFNGTANSGDYYVSMFCKDSWTSAGQITNSAPPVKIQYICGPTITPKPGTDVLLEWSIINPFKGGTNNPQALILEVTNWILNIAAALIVILIIYSGIRFMLAAGRPAEIGRAKKILQWALVGFAVVLIGKGFIALLISVLQGNIPTFP